MKKVCWDGSTSKQVWNLDGAVFLMVHWFSNCCCMWKDQIFTRSLEFVQINKSRPRHDSKKVWFLKCDALRDLVPFVQLKKLEKHPWRSVILSKNTGWSLYIYLKLTLLHGYFSRFLNCTNGTKSRKISQMYIPSFLKISLLEGNFTF